MRLEMTDLTSKISDTNLDRRCRTNSKYLPFESPPMIAKQIQQYFIPCMYKVFNNHMLCFAVTDLYRV